MENHQSIEVLQRSGLAGDFGRKPGRAQVTILSAEKWADACAEIGLDPGWLARRSNLLISGVGLDVVVGRRIEIEDVVLEITGPTDPCHRMDEAVPGLQRALRANSRGGVRCQVVKSGTISLGSKVTMMRSSHDGNGSQI